MSCEVETQKKMSEKSTIDKSRIQANVLVIYIFININSNYYNDIHYCNHGSPAASGLDIPAYFCK